MTLKTLCNACEATQDRETLIETLRSGRFAQHDPRTLDQALRDDSDHYSVTGVATAVIAPMAWVQNHNHWLAVWIDDVHEHAGRQASPGDDVTGLRPKDRRHLFQNTANYLCTCPDLTAYAVGMDPKIWEKSRKLQLHVNCPKIPDEELERLGIPGSRPANHRLDLLSFEQAADLLQAYPQTVVPCRCNR